MRASPRGLRSAAQQQQYGEEIPLQALNAQQSSPSNPPSQPPGNAHYLAENDPSCLDNYPREDAEGNAIQYFRMAPSGQLQEELEEEEALSTVDTYTLSSPEDDRSTLNTYSLSPQTSRAAQHGAVPEDIPRDSAESLSPTAYSGVTTPRRNRSESFPPTSYGEVIPPMRITPDMVQMFMQQLAESTQLGGYPTAGGMNPVLQSPSASSVASSSSSLAAPMSQRLQQQAHPGYRQQLSHPANALCPSSERVLESPGQTRHVHSQPAQLSLVPSAAQSPPESHPASVNHRYAPGAGQSMQTGVYAALPQPQRHWTAPQFTGPTDLPQTDLSSPYAELAQVNLIQDVALHVLHLNLKSKLSKALS